MYLSGCTLRRNRALQEVLLATVNIFKTICQLTLTFERRVRRKVKAS